MGCNTIQYFAFMKRHRKLSTEEELQELDRLRSELKSKERLIQSQERLLNSKEDIINLLGKKEKKERSITSRKLLNFVSGFLIQNFSIFTMELSALGLIRPRWQLHARVWDLG